MSTKTNGIEVLTYAQIVETIGHFADYHMESLTSRDQIQLIEFSKLFGNLSKSHHLTPEQVIAMCLSLAVEFMRFSPEYIATVGKSVEDVMENPCPSPAVN